MMSSNAREFLLVVVAPLLVLCQPARAITFANQTVSVQAPAATGCVVPPSTSSFLTTDSTVYLYFEATVASSDGLTGDWLAPDGTSVAPASWNSGAGYFCFTGSALSVSSLPAKQLGGWQARIFDNGALLFSIPFTVSAPAASGAAYYFPQLAFGGGFQTTLSYVNYSPQTVTCSTTFYSDTGGSLQVPFSGGSVSQRTDSLAAGADIHVQTNAAAGSASAEGWAQVQCSAPVKASLLYRLYSGSVAQGEASVNATTAAATEFVTFAQTQTGIAYANPSTSAATVTVTALDSGGNLLGSKSFALAPSAHGAANIGPLLGLTSFTGSVQITSTVPIVSLALNAEAYPVFSSLPAGDLPAGTTLATGHGGGGSAPVITTFTASPSSIQAGQSSVLAWSVLNAASLSINGGVGTVSGTSISVTPASTTIYTLTASNASGSVSASVTVTVNTSGGGSGPITIKSLSSTSPLPLSPVYIQTTGVNVNAPVNVTFSNATGYSVSTGAIRVDSSGMVVAAVPIYSNASGVPLAGTVSLTISQGTTQSAASTVNIQNLPSVQSYGMAPGQISHAFIVYEEMGIARRINELEAFQGLPGNKVATSQEISQLQNMLLAVIESRNDVDRVAQSSSTVISAGTTAGGTALQFNSSSVDMMDRVLGAYLTQMQPYLAAPPPNVVAAARRRGLSPVLGLSKDGFVRGKVVRSGPRRRIMRAQPRISSASGTMKQLTDYLTYAANGSGIAATLQSYATSDSNFLDKISATTGGLSGVLGLYAQQSLNPAQAFPVNTAAAVLGAVSGGAALLNDLGHELGALAFVVTASDNTDPSVINDAWQEITDKNLHVVIDAAQTELSLFSYGVNSADLPLFSTALNNFGLEAAAVFQTSAESGLINSGFQGVSLFTNLASYYVDHGFDSLANFGTQLYNEAAAGAINVADAFGDLVGSVDITTDLGIEAPLTGIDLSSYLDDSFDTLADPNGNYVMTLPIGDPNFAYSDVDLEAVDPVSDDDLGDVTVNLSSLSSRSAFDLPTVSGSCTDDDASDPDEDDPDCD